MVRNEYRGEWFPGWPEPDPSVASFLHQDRFEAEQLFPAFQALGMTDVVPDTEMTEYDADEFYVR